MEKILNIKITLKLKPNEVHKPLLESLAEKYNSSLFKKYYVVEVLDIIEKKGGKILHDGSILFIIFASCKVLDPDIGSTYNLRITSTNKMGALHKHELITVFVPTQYYNDNTPEVDSCFDITIIGKRIEDSIVCVGKIV